MLSTALVSLIFVSDAQVSKHDDNIYKELAASIRASIWSLDLPAFRNHTVPDMFRATSKVVLARHTDMSAGIAKSSQKSGTVFTSFTRELIAVNDEAAVKTYSELSYTQIQKLAGYTKENQELVFVGIRIIKPNGRMIEVSTDDVVLTKDERGERSGKLAIPDLQPGDIIDRFIATHLNTELNSITTFARYFGFYDDVPVLHYSIHCAVGPKFATEYRCFNGAPDLSDSVDQAGARHLFVKADSVLYIPGDVRWISPMRQFPIIQLNIVRGDIVPYTAYTRRRPGEMFKNQDAGRIIKDEMIDLNNVKRRVLTLGKYTIGKKSESVAAYYDTLLALSNSVAFDYMVGELFYMYRFEYMFGGFQDLSPVQIANISRSAVVVPLYVFLMSEYFKLHGIPAEVVLTTSRMGPKMNEVLDQREFQYLCNVHHKDTDMLLGAYDYFSPAFFTPGYVEGAEDAVAVDTKDLSSYLASKYTTRQIRIPSGTATENVHRETLIIAPDPNNDAVRIARSTSLTGHCKDGKQDNLLTAEDFYNYERQYYDDTLTLIARVAHKNPESKLTDELGVLLQKARTTQKDAFLTEAKTWMNGDVSEQVDLLISNPGIRHYSPAFEYASSFRLNGVLKRAGNNYLLEVGRLVGNFKRIQDNQRDRTFDVYMPYANTLMVDMTIRVPEGYDVEGVQEINKSVRNDAGYFTSTATVTGNLINVKIEQVILSAQYNAKDWPQLLAITDASADWSNVKILYRKKS